MDYYATANELRAILGVGVIINLILLGGLAYAIDVFVSDEVRRLRKSKKQKISLKNRLRRIHLFRINGKRVMPATHC